MHWSVEAPATGSDAPEAQPAPVDEPAVAVSPLVTIPEILEALHAVSPDLVAKLLAELSHCSSADLAVLFGAAPPRTSAEPGDAGRNADP
jgi:hypothetical protein